MGDATANPLRSGEPAPFRVIAFRPVAYGSKVAEFSIETPIGVIEADLFAPEGREAFVQARSVRDKYTGQWRRTIALDRAFAARVLDALQTQATPAKARREQEPKSVAPSEALLETEQGLDAAFAEIGATEDASSLRTRS